MNQDELAATVKAELQKISTNTSRAMDANRDRVGELQRQVDGLQATVLDVAQKGLRRPGAGIDESGHRISEASDAIVAGLADSNSFRTSLPFSIRASLSSDAPGSVGTVQIPLPPVNLGAVSVFHPSMARLIDLLPARPVTSGNSLTMVRVTYGAGGYAAAVVGELAAKPESTVATSGVVVDLLTYAHWIEVSKQVLEDAAELRSVLDGILRGGLLDVVDTSIYATMTSSGNYTAFTPAASETVGDGIARAAAAIAMRGGQGIIAAINPADYLSMSLLKAVGSGIYLGAPPSLASRVVAVPAVAAGKVLAFAPGAGAAWADREGVNVVAGLRNDQLTRNALTLLCECRGAPLIRDPGLVFFGNVTAP